MNLTKKMTLAAGLLVAAAGYAQTTATSSSSNPHGLLGTRYAELNFGVQDVKFIRDHAYGVGASVNTPVVPGAFDAGLTYAYNWIRGPVRAHANTFGGYGIFYVPAGGVKPFVGAGVGWQWLDTRGFSSEDQGVWGATAGVEIPLGRFTLTPRVAYADDFENSVNSSQEWRWSAEGNYALNQSTAVFASLGRSDVARSPARSWDYGLGVRVKF